MTAIMDKSTNIKPDSGEKTGFFGEKRGIALYLAVITMAILLSIAFGMSAISISRMKNITSMGNSVVAFYAAETGIERAIKDATDETYSVPHDYLDINGNGYEDGQDATFQVDGIAAGVGDCPATYDYCIKAIGEYLNTRRTLQVEFK